MPFYVIEDSFAAEELLSLTGGAARPECPPAPCAAVIFLRPPQEPRLPWSWLSSLSDCPQTLPAPQPCPASTLGPRAAGGTGFRDRLPNPHFLEAEVSKLGLVRQGSCQGSEWSILGLSPGSAVRACMCVCVCVRMRVCVQVVPHLRERESKAWSALLQNRTLLLPTAPYTHMLM